MFPTVPGRRLAATLLAAFLTVSAALAKDTPDEKRAAVHKMREAVLADLEKERPGTRDRIKKAEGYAVFSNVGINVILASFAGGSGVVVDKKGRETYMKMGSAGIGLGLGIKDFRAIFIFHDRQKLETFIEKGWDFSGQADAAAKSDDKGRQIAAAATVIPGVEIYQFTKNGLALQATLQGTKYWVDRDLTK